MLLNCVCILVRVLEKTGFHYFIFHHKPLHWGGHGLGLGTVAMALIVFGLGLEYSGLVNITGKVLDALRPSAHNVLQQKPTIFVASITRYY